MHIFYVVVIICVFRFTSARVDLTVRSSACKNYYDMEDIGEAYVTYSGASISDGCYIKFIKGDSFQKTICIKPTNLNLDCSTRLEYHRHFITNYIDPDVTFSCNNVPYSEWCGGVRTSSLYIVFKTSGNNYVDNIKLHVYLKELPKEEYKSPWSKTASHSSSVGIIVGVVVGVIVLTIIITCVIVFVIIQKQRSAQRPQFAYQTTTGQVNMQTGNTGAAPVQPQYLPPTQQTAPGNYTWHPVQSAYPVSMQQDNSPLISNHLAQQQPPSAPSNDVAAPPPSYESVDKM